MSNPIIAEIKMFGGNFAPRGFAFCNGQLLSIAENSALFSLIGTTYGGNGQTTFGLPDLRGRDPMHWGNGAGLSPRQLGESAGNENTTLQAANMPQHIHPFSTTASQRCSDVQGGFDTPGGRVPAISAGTEDYAAGPGVTTLAPFTVAGTTGPAGNNQAFSNMQPYLCVSFIIALEGIYPSRN